MPTKAAASERISQAAMYKRTTSTVISVFPEKMKTPTAV